MPPLRTCAHTHTHTHTHTQSNHCFWKVLLHVFDSFLGFSLISVLTFHLSRLFTLVVPTGLWLQKYPPTSNFVRAVSILTGYFIKATGPNSCIFIYLSQADPKGQRPNALQSANPGFPFLFFLTFSLFFFHSRINSKGCGEHSHADARSEGVYNLISDLITSWFSAALPAMRTVCLSVPTR